jgi:hypothetical protein
MTSRRIAILATGAVAGLAVTPATVIAATHTHSNAAKVSRLDRSRDVGGSVDRSRSENVRPDSSSSPDNSGVGHDSNRA